MTRTNLRWLRVPQLAISYFSPPRHTALARAAGKRPARLAVLIGSAVFCASLAMSAAPAGARLASASAGADEHGRLAADELSSRRHGAGSRHSHASRHGGSKGGGFGKYGLQPDGGYSYGPHPYAKLQKSHGRHKESSHPSFKSRGYAGYGYGDRSFKHHPRSAMYPSAASAYGDRSFKSHGGRHSAGRNYVGFGARAYW